MMYLWLALVVLFGVLEAVTAQLVSIWFVIGALASLVSCMLGANSVVQVIVFAFVSVIVLVATRPLVKKLTKTKIQPTNADAYIGLEAVVTEDINNLYSSGAVRVRGTEWTARSENGDEIGKDEIVTVKSIEGVKLIVERKI